MPVRKTIDDGGVSVNMRTDDVEAGALKQHVVHTPKEAVRVNG